MPLLQKQFIFPPSGTGLLQLGGETGQLFRRDCTGLLRTQRDATGITWSLVYLTRIYQASRNDTRLAFAWGILGARLLPAVITVWILRKKPFSLSKKRLLLLLGGWVVLVLLYIPLPIASTAQWLLTAVTALDYLRLGLLTFLAMRTVNALLAWREARKRP